MQLTTVPNWREAGLRYFSYNFYLRQRFGRRIHKVSVDAGFTCPNVDGTVTTGRLHLLRQPELQPEPTFAADHHHWANRRPDPPHQNAV